MKRAGTWLAATLAGLMLAAGGYMVGSDRSQAPSACVEAIHHARVLMGLSAEIYATEEQLLRGATASDIVGPLASIGARVNAEMPRWSSAAATCEAQRR